MRGFLKYALLSIFFSSSAPLLLAQDALPRAIDVTTYQRITGLEGTLNERHNLYTVAFPRNDIKITVDGALLDPFLGVTSWVGFAPKTDEQFILMADLVLCQDEVNPVLSVIMDYGFDVTALHNHYFFDQPRLAFLHLSGVGKLAELSQGVKKLLDTVRLIRQARPVPADSFGGKPVAEKSSITLSKLEEIFGMRGKAHNGMVKFVIGRTTMMGGFEVGRDAGVLTWLGFAGTDDYAVAEGDFALYEYELQAVIKALRKGNINVTAIHNHMIMENPRVLFVHFWGKGGAETLAKTLRTALTYTQ